ncbi:MAG: hypothetical protein NUV98_05685 [Candidatus Roizmanbacteria bacterium]|nr:hypothetical protein [Candidatus Roizmanbacteria bacterium]
MGFERYLPGFIRGPIERKRAAREAAAATELHQERTEKVGELFHQLFTDLSQSENQDPEERLLLMEQLEQTVTDEGMRLEDVVHHMFILNKTSAVQEHCMFGYDMVRSGYRTLLYPEDGYGPQALVDQWKHQIYETVETQFPTMGRYKNDLLKISFDIFGNPETLGLAHNGTENG